MLRDSSDTGQMRNGCGKGSEALGLEFHVPLPIRLPMLTTVTIPEGVEDHVIRGRLLKEHNIEIAGGLGPLAGQIWRIGLMGYSSRLRNVDRLLSALKELLAARPDPD